MFLCIVLLRNRFCCNKNDKLYGECDENVVQKNMEKMCYCIKMGSECTMKMVN